MRGKAYVLLKVTSPRRITPAYAGKSWGFFRRKFARRDHPRLCGEKFLICRHLIRDIGSPPPMRGKEVIPGKIAKPYRITPAYAGKSRYGLSELQRHSGSPPPMRGKAPNQQQICNNHRITPAYAGKSGEGSMSSFRLKDHPRLCGEKNLFKKLLCVDVGSPPPMRGKVNDRMFPSES